VVAARSLDEGVAWCEATLGITPGPGGRHPLMGTHNRLFAIGSETWPRAYFEIIAIDPDASPPGRARWFGLDRWQGDTPALVHWVARSTNLDMHRWGLVAAGFNAGDTLSAERAPPDGELLRWRIVVPDDGRLLARGALPTLIEWTGSHPADRMPASGVRLTGLRLRGLPTAATQVLQPRGVSNVDGPGPALEAQLQTPRGPVTLVSMETLP
jgi:hypothetical protein